MIFVLLISIYTTRVVLKVLGIIDFGIFNVVAGFVSMFAFINTSMTNGIQRFYNFTMGKEGAQGLTKIFNTSIQIQLIIAVVAIALLETIGLWYVYNKMVIPSERLSTALWIYQFSIFSLVLVIIQQPYSAAVIAHEKMGFFALVSILDAISKLVIALSLPYFDADKLMVYGIYTLAVAILNFTLYFTFSKIHFDEIKLNFHFDKALFKSMFTFSGWNVFGTFAFMLRAQGITVLLNFFFGAAINAAQGIAGQIQSALQGFSGNIVIAFRPQMVQSYANSQYDRVRSMFYSLSKISYILLLLLSVPVIFEIDYILHLWLGDNVPEHSAYFTILVLVNMILLSLHTPIVTIIHASGKMKKFQIVTSVITCSILPISWVFLVFGCNPSTVYWVSLIVQIINQILCLMILKDVFPYKLYQYFKMVVIPLLFVTFAVSVVTLFVWLSCEESFTRLLLVGITSVISTCLAAYPTLTKSEKTVIFKFLRKND